MFLTAMTPLESVTFCLCGYKGLMPLASQGVKNARKKRVEWTRHLQRVVQFSKFPIPKGCNIYTKTDRCINPMPSGIAHCVW